MKKEDIKVIVSDIDGTLINDKDELPSNFIEVINKLNEKGIIFVAASGRGVSSIKHKLNIDAQNIYIISDNGALITHQDTIIKAEYFTQKQYKEVINHFKSFKDNTIGVATTSNGYVEVGSPYADRKLLDEFFFDSQVIQDVNSLQENVIGISVHNEHNTHENFNNPRTQEMLKSYTLVKSGDRWIDAMPKNVH